MEATKARTAIAVSAEFPATPNQCRCWRERDLARGGAALNAPFRRRLQGSVKDSAIAAALQTLVERHEILRTRFREKSDGTLVQEVLEGVEFKLAIVDLRHLPEASRQSELARLGTAEAETPFEFAAETSPAPLFRALMVRTEPDSAVIHFTFHQLIIDGWSSKIVIREFAELVAAIDADVAIELPPVDLHFGDYARWQQDLRAGAALDAERTFWTHKLEGLPLFEVNPDRPRSDDGNEIEVGTRLLPADLFKAFEALARANNHTIFSFAAATASAALHLVTGEPEVVLGTQMAGRDDTDSEKIVGPLLNPVVLRLPVDASAPFVSHADTTRAIVHEAMQHQRLPFAEVAGLAGDEGTPDRHPLYTVSLTVTRANIAAAVVTLPPYARFELHLLGASSAGAQCDLNFLMIGREDGWWISCEGAKSLYDIATIENLLLAWTRVIEEVVARPDAPLRQIVLPADCRRHSGKRTARLTVASEPNTNPRLDALRKRILPLQQRGDKTPIIAINNASVLLPVARAIGADHPFYDIQFCPSPVRIELPRRHFADHARDAVELIRLARPHGPYVLFGFCIYGAIAIEAARILQSEGEDVPLVILNDTYRPGYRERMSYWDRHIRSWQVRWRTSANLYRRVQGGELAWAQLIDNYRICRKLRVSSLLARLGLIAESHQADPMQIGDRWFVEEVLLRSQADFDLKPYRGRVVMFRNEELKTGRLFPPDFGWRGYVDGNLDVHVVPGSHDTMFRAAGARVIGEQVHKILDERQCQNA